MSRETPGRLAACFEATLPQLKHLVKTRIAISYKTGRHLTIAFEIQNANSQVVKTVLATVHFIIPFKQQWSCNQHCEKPSSWPPSAILHFFLAPVKDSTAIKLHFALICSISDHSLCYWNNRGQATKLIIMRCFNQQRLSSSLADSTITWCAYVICWWATEKQKYVLQGVFDLNPRVSAYEQCWLQR